MRSRVFDLYSSWNVVPLKWLSQRDVMPDHEPAENASVAELFAKLPDHPWQEELLRVVGSMLRKKLPSVPEYVGVPEKSWTTELHDELAVRCYANLILGESLDAVDKRRPGQVDKLYRRSQSGASCTAYLAKMVGNYVEDLRRDADKYGNAIMRRIQGVLRDWAEQGRVRLIARKDGELDKFSIIYFCEVVDDKRDVAELRSYLLGWAEWDRVSRPLKTLGTQPIPAIYEIMEFVVGFGAASICLGDLLEVLKECAPTQVEQVYGDREGESSLLAARPSTEHVDPDALIEHIRLAIQQHPDLRSRHRENMLELWDEFAAKRDEERELFDPEAGSSGEGMLEVSPNIAELSARCGWDRRRGHETWRRILEVVREVAGSLVADILDDRPSVDG